MSSTAATSEALVILQHPPNGSGVSLVAVRLPVDWRLPSSRVWVCNYLCLVDVGEQWVMADGCDVTFASELEKKRTSKGYRNPLQRTTGSYRITSTVPCTIYDCRKTAARIIRNGEISLNWIGTPYCCCSLLRRSLLCCVDDPTSQCDNLASHPVFRSNGALEKTTRVRFYNIIETRTARQRVCVRTIHYKKYRSSLVFHVRKIRKQFRGNQEVLSAVFGSVVSSWRPTGVRHNAPEYKTLVAFIKALVDFINAAEGSNHHLLKCHQIHDRAN